MAGSHKEGRSADGPLSWDSVRDLCMRYIELFLKFAEMQSADAYTWFYAEEGRLGITWRRIKQIDDFGVRGVIQDIADDISEAAATRYALPGGFEDYVRQMKKDYEILNMAMTAQETLNAMRAAEE